MHLKTAVYLGVGVLLGLTLNGAISGFADPILASLKLSVNVAG